MKISKSLKLLSHASVLINVNGFKILTDPWFSGTAFNDGWELFPIPNMEEIESEIKDVDVVWISHEHPDHLHFPTLKHIKSYLPDNVKIAFQSINSTKVFDALRKLGYLDFIEMPTLKKIDLNSNLQIGVYQHRHLDSALAIFVEEKFWVLNINDAELNSSDTKIIKEEWGSPSVLINQFSIAGFNGIEKSLKMGAKNVITKMCKHHTELDAQITIPFASFVIFARKDNSFMNRYANSPLDVEFRFLEENLNVTLLSHQGEALEWLEKQSMPHNLELVHNNSKNYFLELYRSSELIPDNFKIEKSIKSESIKIIESRVSQLKGRTNLFLWGKLNPFIFKVQDWDNENWQIDFKSSKFTKVSSSIEHDIEINSQPLEYAFKLPFGIQTLGVSGRYRFNKKYSEVPLTWRLLRIISSLDNASVHTSLKGVLKPATLKWAWSRRVGLISQVAQQWQRFKR